MILQIIFFHISLHGVSVLLFSVRSGEMREASNDPKGVYRGYGRLVLKLPDLAIKEFLLKRNKVERRRKDIRKGTNRLIEQ